MNDKNRILVIGAHPADIFDQSAGTMAHHTARGDWVGCVVLTHGARIHDRVISDEMFHRTQVPEADELTQMMAERSDVKAQEVVTACALVGVKEQDIYFFGEDDAVLTVNDQNVRRLARMIRQIKPNIIITHFPKEDGAIGSPHATTGQIVMHALFLAAGVDPGDRNPPHRGVHIFYFGQGAAAARRGLWGAEGGFYNDVLVDITDVAHIKVACLDALQSQGYDGAYARKRIEVNDGAFGTLASSAYAEGFIRNSATVGQYLPISDMDRALSRLSDQELIQRRSYRLDETKIPFVKRVQLKPTNGLKQPS
ncbi:MAG: PIG-L family deacetylase [Phycisphaerales bacterium]|nr:PIG-L family deacetylase [Phycisphaerales bacterium]